MAPMRDPKRLDDTRLLPRYRPAPALAASDQLEIARARRAAFTSTPGPSSSWNRADQLRGIPVVGGCAGVSPGTDPLRETLRRDAQRARDQERADAATTVRPMSDDHPATVPVSWIGGPKSDELGGITPDQAAAGYVEIPDGADPSILHRYELWAEMSEMHYQGRRRSAP
jgi:hypothetical protein